MANYVENNLWKFCKKYWTIPKIMIFVYGGLFYCRTLYMLKFSTSTSAYERSHWRVLDTCFLSDDTYNMSCHFSYLWTGCQRHGLSVYLLSHCVQYHQRPDCTACTGSTCCMTQATRHASLLFCYVVEHTHDISTSQLHRQRPLLSLS